MTQIKTEKWIIIESVPNEWDKSICKIHGKIIYFSPMKIQSNNCFTIYDVILRDDNYAYHHITVQENKNFYRDLSGTVAKEISCAGKYINLWNSLTPKIWDTFYYVIRKYYDFDNYLINSTKNQNLNWDNIQNCEWSIIDKIPENIIQEKNTFSPNYCFWWAIFLLIILWALAFKLYKKNNKKEVD